MHLSINDHARHSQGDMYFGVSGAEFRKFVSLTQGEIRVKLAKSTKKHRLKAPFKGTLSGV